MGTEEEKKEGKETEPKKAVRTKVCDPMALAMERDLNSTDMYGSYCWRQDYGRQSF